MELARAMMVDLEAESKKTRQVLERIPADRADWRPHEKSMSLGSLAGHVASLPGFGDAIIARPSLDMGTEHFPDHKFTTAEAAVEHAAGAAAELRSVLSTSSDEDLLAEFQLKYNGQVVGAGPRVLLYRTMFFNHLIHHRGQLSVYLRLLDVPVPGIYGPSADEPWKG